MMNHTAIADYVRRMQRSAEQGELYGFADDCRRLLTLLDDPLPGVALIYFEEKNKVKVFNCIPPKSEALTLPEALRYHATLMLAPEVSPRVQAALLDAARLMRDAASALEGRR